MKIDLYMEATRLGRGQAVPATNSNFDARAAASAA